MLTARKTMDVVAAYKDVGTYRGAAVICGVDPKTVKRKVQAHEAGQLDEERVVRASVPKNTDVARDLVAQRVERTKAKISAKRLLSEARAVGYVGSARNFRRLVAAEKRKWRAKHARQRRPAVWTPGDTLVIDWGTLPGTGIHVFCAVLAWSRIRFVRYARDETAVTTFSLLAECFEALGGVPAKVLADRMGCLKAGTVAGVVIPTPDYVRFATHYGFSPDFCAAGDPESKGIVEHLVGYAKRDIPTPDADADLASWNQAAVDWCAERNGVEHSETCAVPDDRLAVEAGLLRPLPVLRPRIGRAEIRKVDKLATIRVASVRYSVPSTLVGTRVEAVTYDGVVRIYRIDTGEFVATHDQLAPGESSILDEHYPTPRKPPSRGPRARTETERAFLALGESADAFIRAGAAAGMTMLPKEIEIIVAELLPAHGDQAVTRALGRAVRFSRFRADDVRSILAIGAAAPEPAAPGERVVVDLPVAEQRSLDAFKDLA
jgi:transposase